MTELESVHEMNFLDERSDHQACIDLKNLSLFHEQLYWVHFFYYCYVFLDFTFLLLNFLIIIYFMTFVVAIDRNPEKI